jgi:hypothetical protein
MTISLRESQHLDRKSLRKVIGTTALRASSTT